MWFCTDMLYFHTIRQSNGLFLISNNIRALYLSYFILKIEIGIKIFFKWLLKMNIYNKKYYQNIQVRDIHVWRRCKTLNFSLSVLIYTTCIEWQTDHQIWMPFVSQHPGCKFYNSFLYISIRVIFHCKQTSPYV